MSRAREVSKIVETVENFDAVEYSSTPPANPQTGALWVDTSTVNPLIKAYNGDDWDTLGSAPVPIITGIAPSNISGSASTSIIVNGTNFESGSIVKLVDNEDNELHVLSTTFNNSQSLQFLTPTLTASVGPYDIKVTNTDSQFSIFENSLTVGNAPVWQTQSGLLGNIFDSFRSSTTFSLSAIDLDNNPVTYYLSSGSLPPNMSLSSSGLISGTTPGVSSDTTYAFTVSADDGNSVSNRNFSITVKSPHVQYFNNIGSTSWTAPQNGNIEVLVVAGGGGGPGGTSGYGSHGGGGAGGVIHHQSFPVVKDTVYNIVVGSGGAGGAAGAGGSANARGKNGSNSSFEIMTAFGGGGGAPQDGTIGNAGGSGGGGAGGGNPAPAGGGSATQTSNNGGTGYGSNGAGGAGPSTYPGGGGGGAGGAGSTNGTGGVGRQFSITGVPTFYAGGGGSGNNSYGVNAASGGNGGGGSGGSTGSPGGNGSPNTGGGGGAGSSVNPGTSGGSGGSGVVILRY